MEGNRVAMIKVSAAVDNISAEAAVSRLGNERFVGQGGWEGGSERWRKALHSTA